MRQLKCNGCTNLTEIPNIEELGWLNCSYCPKITKIPHIEELLQLDCNGCTSLTEIPDSKGLKSLYCRGCTSLTKLPDIRLEWLNCEECPWIPQQNNEYKENISNLITLQRWVKVKLKKLKLKQALLYTRNPKLFSWFYSPNHRGGKINKKSMEKFLFKIKIIYLVP